MEKPTTNTLPSETKKMSFKEVQDIKKPNRRGIPRTAKYRVDNINKELKMQTILYRAVNPPTTRYQGSKQKIVSWIWGNIQDLSCETFLDAFSGTGIVGYYAKVHGKEVTSNDILKINSIISKSIIENSEQKLTEKDLNFILDYHSTVEYPSFIQDTFRDIYYTDEENKWLDMVITNIGLVEDEYKKVLALNALFQSCIAKRPYNLFHRKNLYVRLATVERSFGNKKTWDTPFPDHFKKFVEELNGCVFDNGKNNRSLNLDAFEIPHPGMYDLVYIDTPYFSSHSMLGVDYRDFYHFLEGVVNYANWNNMIDWKSKHLRLKRVPCVWTNKEKIFNAFDQLFQKFQKSTLVISYRDGGIPSKEEMVSLLKQYKSDVTVKTTEYKYALSNGNGAELLFIAK